MLTMKVAFVDVGGTLWPDVWPTLAWDRQERISRLRGREPGLSEQSAAELIDGLAGLHHPPTTRQQTDVLVIDALRRCGLIDLVRPDNVIEAMCLPATGRVEVFSGAHRLLAALSAQARVVIVSNTMWRTRDQARDDFEQFGLAAYVSAYVMSIDVGWRKPHARYFAAALAAAGVPPDQCVIVGDSETNDIEPARRLGMRAIRVAIEVPGPAATGAEHLCTSLDGVADFLLDQPARRPAG